MLLAATLSLTTLGNTSYARPDFQPLPLEEALKKLELTTEQQTKTNTIVTEDNKRYEELLAKHSLTDEQLTTLLKDTFNAKYTTIRSLKQVLTAAQMERLIRLMKPRHDGRPCKPKPDDQDVRPCNKPKPDPVPKPDDDVVIMNLLKHNS